MSIAQRLANIFDEAFGLDPDQFSLDAAPEDVPNWDSVGHMNLVMLLEKEFGQQLGSVFGALMVSDGIGFGVGPWIAGNIYDATGSYQASFTAAAAGLMIAAVLTLVIKPVKTNPGS